MVQFRLRRHSRTRPSLRTGRTLRLECLRSCQVRQAFHQVRQAGRRVPQERTAVDWGSGWFPEDSVLEAGP